MDMNLNLKTKTDKTHTHTLFVALTDHQLHHFPLSNFCLQSFQFGRQFFFLQMKPAFLWVE